jgi:bile acid-coenzyme A ligase
VVGLPHPDLGASIHAVLQLRHGADGAELVSAMPGFLADILGKPKHPESYEFLAEPVRDDAGKVRRTMLRDERIRWAEEGVAFQTRPVR